jgi:predicted GIY-YIG superfamily endonuclease
MKCVERRKKGIDVNMWFVRRRKKREAFHLDGCVKKKIHTSREWKIEWIEKAREAWGLN